MTFATGGVPHAGPQQQPTPVFLPGESQGQRSLVGCCLWGLTESDMTEQLNETDIYMKIYDQLKQHIKKQRHHFAYKGLYSQSYGFSSSHIWV